MAPFKCMFPVMVFSALLCTVGSAAWAGDVKVSVTDATGKALPDAVVFLTSPTTKTLVKPLTGSEISQVARQFVPRVSVVTVGSAVSFPNKDTVRHHVYSFSPAKVFDLKLYAGTPTSPVVFDVPGPVALGCNIHDKMAAWLFVVDTPYYAKTGATGSITLTAIPNGNYKLHVWHPNIPVGIDTQEQPVSVSANETSVVVALKNLSP